MSPLCKVCGNKARGAYCFRHKPRRPIAKTRKKAYVKRPETKSSGYKKVKSVRSLKSTLWQWVSKYIRLRDSNQYGFGKCITCGNIEYWKFADAGHGIPRKHNATFVHEKNLGLQCKGCNQIHHGRSKEFAKATDERYGVGTWEMLKILSKQSFRFTPWELEELIEHYTKEVSRLLKEKNL